MRIASTLLLVVALSESIRPAAEAPWFRADPAEVVAGGPVTLTWGWAGAKDGYLSSHGHIDHPSDGSAIVLPLETTSYVLVLEAPGVAPRILSVRVAVTGAKGGSGEWPPDLFVPLEFRREFDSRASLVKLAVRLRSLLQDEWGFETRQFVGEGAEVVLATAYRQQSTLDDPREGVRRIRRIAYRTSLRATGTAAVHIQISASIQWRPVVDTRWFPESSSSSDRYKKETDRLWESLQKMQP